jgi:hypothetical protein
MAVEWSPSGRVIRPPAGESVFGSSRLNTTLHLFAPHQVERGGKTPPLDIQAIDKSRVTVLAEDLPVLA